MYVVPVKTLLAPSFGHFRSHEELKAGGMYVARSLGYTGAEFEVANVPITTSFRQKYDRACEWWQLLFRVFQKADEFLNGKGIRWSQFWGAHMRAALVLAPSRRARAVALWTCGS